VNDFLETDIFSLHTEVAVGKAKAGTWEEGVNRWAGEQEVIIIICGLVTGRAAGGLPRICSKTKRRGE
jgi:hypothetical protein